MARMKRNYTLSFGRDEGKQFTITEMPSAQSESWAFCFISVLAKSVADVINPLDGMAGLAGLVQGYKNKASSEGDLMSLVTTFIKGADPKDIKPLLDELMSCVTAISPTGEERKVVPNDIEEGRNLMELKIATLVFHATIFISGGEKKRKIVDLRKWRDGKGEFKTAQNVTYAIAKCAKTPTDLFHLSTSLGLCDLYDMVEILDVDAYNQREAIEAAKVRE